MRNWVIVGVIALSIAIGLSVGRPFDSSGPSAELATSAPSTSTVAPATSPPATPTLAPTSLPAPTSPIATPAPVDGWLIRSTETFERPSNWPAKEAPGWASGYQDGRYFLKLDGPAKTIAAVENDFRASFGGKKETEKEQKK